MNAALPPVAIEGVAFWHTRLPGWATARAVIGGEQAAPAAAATRPTPSLLAPTERRRAPDTVALALEVAARACEAAGRSPAQLRSVF
ncbi:MAG: beta-ketoacyl synthase chain length factor, partial [Steroidobacteraceae bacterium]